MLGHIAENIFIYNKEKQNFNMLAPIEDLHSLNSFVTDNIYQLYQYTQNIAPKVLIFNITDTQSLADLKSIIKHRQNNYPLIVISPPTFEIPLHPQIAHYLKTNNLPELLDIIESYGVGGKKHDILLLDTYLLTPSPLKIALQQKSYKIFEVHNIEAAKHYLNRNKPKIVGIEYVPVFIPARHTLQHSHIFYVDRAQDITEIEKFLH